MPVLATATLTVLQGIASTHGLTPNFEFDPVVLECDEDPDRESCLNQYVEDADYIPEAMGQVVALEILRNTEDDGFNQDGKYSSEYNNCLRGGSRSNPTLNCPKSKKTCTANCRPYDDTVGYYPDKAPWDRVTHENQDRWEPLEETNQRGYFVHQEHVTPHIGCTVTPMGMTREELMWRKSPNPNYNYRREAELTVQRMAELTDEKKMLVELFDNKVTLAAAILLNVLSQNPGIDYVTAQWGVMGYLAAEFDATIMAWKEKVRWDRIRPTTVIQRWGDKKITTWAGPFLGTDEIRARDFQAYFRVMPHSEYPSGSACLCTSIAEYIDHFMEHAFDKESLTVTWVFAAGSSLIEPGATPSEDIVYTFEDMTDLAYVCGQSRLYGGIHFTAAVTQGHKLCEGLGTGAYEYALELLPEA